MSAINKKIEKVFSDFGKETAKDLKDSAEKALKDAGRKGVQGIRLDFNELIKTTPTGDVILDIQAANGKKGVKYWRYIEEGRKKGAKMIPAKVVGKEWQNQYNIDPRVVLLSIEARRKKKLGINATRKTLERPKKSLNYDKAATQLSFVIQRSIFKKGIKPKPFVDRVLSDGRINKLREDLTPLLGERFKLIIKGLE